MDKVCALARRIGFLESCYARCHPAGYPFFVAVGVLGAAQADGMLEPALFAVVFELHASTVLHASPVAFVEGLRGSAAFFVDDVVGHVGPVHDFVLDVRFYHFEELFKHERPFGMLPALLPFSETSEVVVLEVMQRDDGFTPLLLAVAYTHGRFAIEHGPVAAKWDATLLEHLCQHIVTRVIALDILPEEMSAGEMLVLAKHAAECHDLLECAAREDIAAAAMRI